MVRGRAQRGDVYLLAKQLVLFLKMNVLTCQPPASLDALSHFSSQGLGELMWEMETPQCPSLRL